MPRPKKAPTERRSDRLPAPRVTAFERAFVEASAAAAGIDTAEYIRRRALDYRVTPKRATADELALAELNRVGTNLNQITARFHMTGDLADDMAETLAHIRAAVERVAGP